MTFYLRLVIVVIIGMGMSARALALPRFASRNGAKCQSCHINPSGGGMRQAFGVQYGRETLPVPTWSDEFALDEFSTKLTEFISIGADFRTLFYYQQNPDTGTPPISVKSMHQFYQMQGDIYVHYRLAKKVGIYLDKGLAGGFEIFGMLSILPGNGYLKVGKFVPNYGTKVDDHRNYVRTYTGFSAELGRPELSGAEIGFHPGPISITGGVYNAADVLGVGSEKAFLGRAEGMFQAAEDFHVGIGGNIFTKRNSSTRVRTTMMGGFGSFSYQDLTILGEVDFIQNKLGGARTTGIVTFAELGYVVTQGLDLKLSYDFYDPDKDLKTGSLSKYSIGFEFFPITGVEVRPVYRIVRDEPVDVKNDEFQFLIHFYL